MKKIIKIFMVLCLILVGCSTKVNGEIGVPIELSENEEKLLLSSKLYFYYQIMGKSCEFYPDGNPNYWGFCSNVDEEKYYVSDPILYYFASDDDKYTLEKAPRFVTLLFQNDNPFFFKVFIVLSQVLLVDQIMQNLLKNISIVKLTLC